MYAHGLRPPLVGRDDEARSLARSLDRVASGRLAVVLMEGEAGIGKTRLLEAATEAAGMRGMSVVVGRARELEINRPFGLLTDAFEIATTSPDPRRARIAALLATQTDGGRGPLTVTSDPGLQFRVVDAMGDLIEELALTGPLVVGVDDLQWADPSSLLTLAMASRRLADLPVGLVACLRPAPRTPMLDQLVSALVGEGAEQLLVGALDECAVHDLAVDVLAAQPHRNLLTQIAGTAGNPLFVIELLQVLLREGDISIDDGFADVTGTALPPSLRMTIVRRLSFLPEDTVRTLTSASLLGCQFALTDLATVTGRPAAELSDSLSEALRANVVGDDGTSLYFRHDLIRDALYEDLAADIRRALHREAGHRLAARGAPTLQIAEHLARGALSGDDEAVDWIVRAAREALSSSPQIAAHLLQQAVALTHTTDSRRDRLLVEQAEATMWTGQVAQAQSLCESVLGRPHDPDVEATALLCLGLALLSSGRPLEGLAELGRVAQAPSATAAERAAGLAWSSTALVWLGELDRAAATAEEARRAATAVGERMSVSVAVTMLSGIARLRGHLQESLRLSDEALRTADQCSPGQGRRYPIHAPRAYVLIELDRLEEARSSIETGMQISEQFGTSWPGYQIVRALERYTVGEWNEAVTEIDAMSDLAADTGEAYGLAIALNVLAVINLHRNDLDGAEAAVQSATVEAERAGVRDSGYWAQWAASVLLEALGRTDEAYRSLCGVWQRCTDLGSLMEYRVFGADLVRLALATGNPGRAYQTAAALTELAMRSDVPTLRAMALRCRGLADGDAGLLVEAARLYAGTPRPLERASACEDAGAALLGRGDVHASRTLLLEACDTYEGLGATRDLARTEALLRSAGLRRGRRGQRRRPRNGWASLTATELAVADLVAEGLSNPQIGERLFVSRRTVQTHLAHIFAKLDLSSRTQLVAQVTRHRS